MTEHKPRKLARLFLDGQLQFVNVLYHYIVVALVVEIAQILFCFCSFAVTEVVVRAHNIAVLV